jgi:predicted lactoylglutathione lyase
MNEIRLTLTLEEVNSVLNALGTQPYAQVQPLIAKIQTQGSKQLQATQNGQQQMEGVARSPLLSVGREP